MPSNGIGFRRKLVVFIEWVWLYLTGGRGARLITGDDRMPKVIEPPPDSRLTARPSRPPAAPTSGDEPVETSLH